MQTHYDAVIVGGGHNGLTAAAYLARAGKSVLVLERRGFTGGAVVSQQTFKGVDARLSRYSYLLSMMPTQIMDDLGLRIEARRRPTASYNPTIRDGKHTALLVSNSDPAATMQSFAALTGGDAEYAGWNQWYALVQTFAEKVWGSMLQPLISRDAMKAQFSTAAEIAAWDTLIENPLGEGIEAHLKDDISRGVAFTDATICALTYPHDPTLLQNRTYLYHTIGNVTGTWHVVTGGMGQVASELERRARAFGAQIVTDAHVTHIDPASTAEITYQQGDQTHTVTASYVLVNAAPTALEKLIPDYSAPTQNVEGSAFKINMIVKRLPRLKSGIDPKIAFAGTFHIDEGYQDQINAYNAVQRGELPNPIGGEIYCHTLTDPTIISPDLYAQGYHTLTLFGVNAPYRFFEKDNETVRAEVLSRYVHGINQYLDEPLEDCLASDADGNLCIEAKSAVDLENELNMPKGHIFHKDMTWVFADEPHQAGTWGVETQFNNVFICGSGAARGGCVSGIPGHNAAMKTLELLGK